MTTASRPATAAAPSASAAPTDEALMPVDREPMPARLSRQVSLLMAVLVQGVARLVMPGLFEAHLRDLARAQAPGRQRALEVLGAEVAAQCGGTLRAPRDRFALGYVLGAIEAMAPLDNPAIAFDGYLRLLALARVYGEARATWLLARLTWLAGGSDRAFALGRGIARVDVARWQRDAGQCSWGGLALYLAQRPQRARLGRR